MQEVFTVFLDKPLNLSRWACQLDVELLIAATKPHLSFQTVSIRVAHTYRYMSAY